MTSSSNKVSFLIAQGWYIGERNPRINTDFTGKFMCVEPYEETQLPTQDGSNGPWAIVGDDIVALVEEAYNFVEETQS